MPTLILSNMEYQNEVTTLIRAKKNIRTYTTSLDIKRALTGKGSLIGVVGVVLVIALSSLQNIIEITRSATPLQNGFHAQLITAALSSD